MSVLEVNSKTEPRRDFVALGEILLRFDPGERRIHDAREFKIWGGGAEYNVAANLSRVFRQRTAIVTALVDNPLGRLAENFAAQSGVDVSEIVWREENENRRNGLYFIERGFGLRVPNSCFDRSNTAISQIGEDGVDWEKIFGACKTRWFHTGGIFAGLSETTPQAAFEAMRAARASGAIVSFDLNYRESLWKTRGGRAEADRISRNLLPLADVVFGVFDFSPKLCEYDAENFKKSAALMQREFPNLKIVATTLRDVKNASQHDFSAVCLADGEVFKAKDYRQIPVLDRVGSGDAFAAGLIYGVLSEKEMQFAVECGAACGALAMTEPGDNSSATLREIERLLQTGESDAVR